MKRTNDLGRDPVFKLVCRLAIPTMLAQLVSVLYSIVDRIYISNIPLTGETALAGVGVCGRISKSRTRTPRAASWSAASLPARPAPSMTTDGDLPPSIAKSRHPQKPSHETSGERSCRRSLHRRSTANPHRRPPRAGPQRPSGWRATSPARSASTSRSMSHERASAPPQLAAAIS